MKRVITFGEIMLRLRAPGHERLFQSPQLEARFGGGEANVAASLALFGLRATFVTALSRDAIGEGAVRILRGYGVDVSRVRLTSDRTGIYFLETGADQRPSQVVYDRSGSAAAMMKPGDFPWGEIFQGADWFHFTGITPALSRSAADACLEASQAARAAGLRVSIDLNFRKKLWNYGAKAPDVMRALVRLADVLIANEEDIQQGLGLRADADPGASRISASAYQALAARTRAEYPNLDMVAITLRESLSADRNGWSAVLDGREGFRQSRKYALDDIVDRVGGGDAFAAGLIFGLLEFGDEGRALEYTVAASALKHSIPGDINLATRDEVERLAGGDGSGRVQR